VAAGHRRWWRTDLADLKPENLVVQPCNRGTACGILLPLVTLLERDPKAVVLFSPSDHVVEREGPLVESISRAAGIVREEGQDLVVLGVEPESPDTGYGWITPSRQLGRGLFEVLSFVEKPDRERAKRLIEEGALWNSFIFVARAAALMDAFEWTIPWLTRLFVHVASTGGIRRRAALSSLYDRLPTLDFSRDVLQGLEEGLRVLAVPPCGWVDLGTPERLAATAARLQGCPIESNDSAPMRSEPLLELTRESQAAQPPDQHAAG
jgi:mannose-1-phosphate guanylyltransferase